MQSKGEIWRDGGHWSVQPSKPYFSGRSRGNIWRNEASWIFAKVFRRTIQCRWFEVPRCTCRRGFRLNHVRLLAYSAAWRSHLSVLLKSNCVTCVLTMYDRVSFPFAVYTWMNTQFLLICDSAETKHLIFLLSLAEKKYMVVCYVLPHFSILGAMYVLYYKESGWTWYIYLYQSLGYLALNIINFYSDTEVTVFSYSLASNTK